MKPVGNLLKNGAVIVPELFLSRSLKARLKGVIGLERLGRDKAVLIEPCGAIHTCFVRFRLDAVFLDRERRIVKICRDIKPWRFMVSGGLKATSVIEMESGWFDWSLLHEGDRVDIQLV